MDQYRVDSSSTNAPLPAAAAPVKPTSAMRVRLRFRKGGDVRFLSHHDLLRNFERLLRRGNLPFHRTQGFHPHPRLVFALSLPLGVVGCDEVAELELDEVIPEEELLQRLRANAPPGLDILSVRQVSLKSSPQVKSLCYRMPVPAERAAAIQARIDALLLTEETIVTRGEPLRTETPQQNRGREDVTRVNVRPFFRSLRLVETERPETLALEIDLWLTPAGTAKPLEVFTLLELNDLLEAGAVIERARLELHDETGERGALAP